MSTTAVANPPKTSRKTMVAVAKPAAVAASDFKILHAEDEFGCLLGSKPNKINELLKRSDAPLSIEEVSQKTGVALSLTKDYFLRYGIMSHKKLASVLVKTADDKYYINK